MPFHPKNKVTLQQHIANWSDCELCELCTNRIKPVLYRGSTNCDIIFIGEAPSEADTILGHPFYSPPGRILKQLISTTFDKPLKYGYTNIIACPTVPLNEDAKSPNMTQAVACQQRLKECLKIAKPKLIALLGKGTEKLFNKLYPDYAREKIVTLPHPNAILRQEDNFELEVERFRVTLSTKWESING